jgi:type III pantothenate kinase
LATLMGGGSKYIREIDDLLTLDGLRIIYERNQVHARRRNDHSEGNGAEAQTRSNSTGKARLTID